MVRSGPTGNARRGESLLAAMDYHLAAGQVEAAEKVLRRLARKTDCNPAVHEQLGQIYVSRGNLKEGILHLKRALRSGTQSAEQYGNLGYALSLAGDGAGARDFLTRAINLDPAFHPAHNLLGILCQKAGDHRQASEHFAHALEFAPRNWSYLSNFGLLKHDIGDHAGAIEMFEAALAHGGAASAEVLNNLANVLMRVGRFDEAVAHYDHALRIDPEFFDALYNRANALKELGRYDKAYESYRAAISLRSDDAKVHFACAENLLSMGRFAEAYDTIERYLGLVCDSSVPQRDDLIELGKRLYRLECVPAVYRNESDLVATRDEVSENLERLSACIERVAGNGSDALKNFPIEILFVVSLFYLTYQQGDDIDLMRSYSRVLRRLLNIEVDYRPPAIIKGGKIRFGIASELLRHHNSSKWAYEWMVQLPSSDYEFFCYAFHEVRDDLTEKFASLGKFQRLPFTSTTFRSTIEQLRADNLHVLLFPDVGMTASSRIISQFRIAPIQIVSRGHPVTTGSPNVDFFLSSDLMEPIDGARHYSEKLIRLPNIAFFLREGGLGGQNAKAIEFPSDRVIYGSLQSLMKYLPRYDHVFPRIAKRVENALFVFIEGDPGYATSIFKERLDRAFAHEGLDASRYVRLLPRMGMSEFRSLFGRLDIIIDPIGWNGDNTTIQALEMDRPLVTLPTELMRGRHGLGILKMAGLERLIASSVEDFVDRLVRLGADGEFRRQTVSLIKSNKHRLYEDRSLIEALDGFLKREVGALGA